MQDRESTGGAYRFLERRWLWLPLLLAALTVGGVTLVWLRSPAHHLPDTPVQKLLQPLRDAPAGRNWFQALMYSLFHSGRSLYVDQSEVARDLQKLGAPAVPELIVALKEDVREVRWVAATDLGEIKDPAAVAPLIEALAADRESSVREAAAQALGQLKDPAAVEPLIAALKDRDQGVRMEAAKALGELGDRRAVAPLI